LYVSSSSFFNNIEDGPIYLFKSNNASAVNLILLLSHFNNIYFLLILGANVSKILTKFVKKNLKILTGKIINLLKKYFFFLNKFSIGTTIFQKTNVTIGSYHQEIYLS
jgi:hypothetical protein